MTSPTPRESDAHLALPEAAARRLVLVQAIDAADREGRLLGAPEREQLEAQALAASRPAPHAAPDAGRYLQERAERLLAAIARRDPGTAALQEEGAWQRWLAWLLPLAALVAGAAIDRIDNPRQVNLLSPPLLAFLAWNLLVYAGLLLAWVVPRRPGPLDAWQRWLSAQAARRSGNLRADVAAGFRLRWTAVAGRLERLRWTRLLHVSALAWALGVALSIVLGGLVREYRIGWESTLLELPQVHAFLRVLFWPVVALLPVEGFSLAELQQLHFRSGVEPDRLQARRWVGLYVALLLLIVALPRALLALAAGWRARRLACTVALDIGQPDLAEVLARVRPVRVLLAVLPGDAAEDARLLHALRLAGDTAPAPPHWSVLSTARGDELRALLLPPDAAPPALPGAAPRTRLPGPLARWWGAAAAPPSRADTLQRTRDEADVVVLAGAGRAQAAPLLQWLGKPVLALPPEAPPWTLAAALRDGIAAQLPPHKAAGMARIVQDWRAREDRRFDDAMRAIASELVLAAREAQEVQGGALNLRRLVDPAQREAGQHARRAAMEAVLQRVAQAQARTQSALLRLHAVDEGGAALAPPQEGDDRFRVHETVDAPQAGMAGAASGAALGATLDLMVGGLTLGAATALGAVVGGASASIAALWKNRTAPGGTPQVQLGDEMLQALAEAALLRYLRVLHTGGTALPQTLGEGWRAEVVAAVEAERPRFDALWLRARTAPDDAPVAAEAADLLREVMRRVLARLA